MPDGVHGALRDREAATGLDRRGSCVPGDLGRLGLRDLPGPFAARVGDTVGSGIGNRESGVGLVSDSTGRTGGADIVF